MEKQVKAQQVYQRFALWFGEPAWTPCPHVIDELILTILSANTNDTNSGRAFAQLKARFGEDWDTVRLAPLAAIKEAIRPAGMYHQKAAHLVATLERIKHDQGNYELNHLATMPVVDAFAYLTALPGVGHKTASIVLLFCFNGAAFPVDTHVQRISQRLGISPRHATPEKVKALWETLLPPATFYPLHLNLIRHGREICQARTPKCGLCPLSDLCDYAQQAGEWQPTVSQS
ncbi:MAG: endonuclease III [Caldilineaceae bacterium]|nr:endonuclease III [Caldilineaceae bacterium]